MGREGKDEGMIVPGGRLRREKSIARRKMAQSTRMGGEKFELVAREGEEGGGRRPRDE